MKIIYYICIILILREILRFGFMDGNFSVMITWTFSITKSLARSLRLHQLEFPGVKIFMNYPVKVLTSSLALFYHG